MLMPSLSSAKVDSSGAPPRLVVRPSRTRSVRHLPPGRRGCNVAWQARPTRVREAGKSGKYRDSENPTDNASRLQNWTDLYVSWSPLGTYMVTMHRQGVQIWGGPSWERLTRFVHPLAKLVDFSPCENYIVTWSHDDIHVQDKAPQGPQYFSPEDEGNNLAIWDVRTGYLLRTFRASPHGADSDNKQRQQLPWPQVKWSPDDKYVARVTPGQQISVYELPGMHLHGKKSIKIEGVVDFEWCPIGDRDREEETKNKKIRENLLAFWTPEVANQPARVTLMSFPTRAVLRSKNLFNVSEVCLRSAVPKHNSYETNSSANCISKIKATSCASR
jgi:translation initiation factor 3 subunit B